MNRKETKLQAYERMKKALKQKNMSFIEYEAAVRKLAQRLKI